MKVFAVRCQRKFASKTKTYKKMKCKICGIFYILERDYAYLQDEEGFHSLYNVFFHHAEAVATTTTTILDFFYSRRIFYPKIFANFKHSFAINLLIIIIKVMKIFLIT